MMNNTAQILGGIEQVVLIADAVMCGLIALVLIFYRRDGSTFRPNAGRVAYVTVIAAAAVPVMVMFGNPIPTYLPSTLLHGVLLMAVLATRGNVVDLFYSRIAEHWIFRWLRKDRRRHEHTT